MRYWPTIAERELNVETDGSFNSIAITDTIGKVFYNDETIKGKKSIAIDASRLVSGIYIVRLIGAEKGIFFRIVKK